MFQDRKRGSHMLRDSPDTRHTLGSVTWTSRNGPFRASPGCHGQNTFPLSLQAAGWCPPCYPPSGSLCGFLLSHFHPRCLLTWFPGLLHVIYISLQAFAGQNQTLMETVMNWQIYQVIPLFPKYQSSIQRMTEPEETSGQCGTWTSLDENRQEILLDVCPSIHLWKIVVMGWKTGSKRNIMCLETDVQHITVTQGEPSRSHDSSLIPDV